MNNIHLIFGSALFDFFLANHNTVYERVQVFVYHKVYKMKKHFRYYKTTQTHHVKADALIHIIPQITFSSNQT